MALAESYSFMYLSAAETFTLNQAVCGYRYILIELVSIGNCSKSKLEHST